MIHPRVKELLDRWRELERELATADAELRENLAAEIERVHREYVEATEAVAATLQDLEAHTLYEVKVGT